MTEHQIYSFLYSLPFTCFTGGPFSILAAIEDPAVIAKILSHLGLPTRPPPRAPARFDAFMQTAYSPPWIPVQFRSRHDLCAQFPHSHLRRKRQADLIRDNEACQTPRARETPAWRSATSGNGILTEVFGTFPFM